MALLIAAALASATPADGPPPEAPVVVSPAEVAPVEAPPAEVAPVATPAPEAATATEPAPTPATPPKSDATDPFEPVNRVFYAINRPIDRFLIRPASIVYKRVLPEPIRDGARNAISNLLSPVGVLNHLFQLRPRRALRATARILINTTIGLGGLFDMAKRKPFRIPDQDNGFADTLGYYGVKPGPYVFLPLLGPTTLRDMVGATGDYFTQPRVLGIITRPSSKRPVFTRRLRLGQYSMIITVVDGLDERVRADADLERIRKQSVDPYASLRAYYLQNRAGQIAKLKAKDGEEPHLPEDIDPLQDPAAQDPAAPPPASPAPETPAPETPAPAQPER